MLTRAGGDHTELKSLMDSWHTYKVADAVAAFPKGREILKQARGAIAQLESAHKNTSDLKAILVKDLADLEAHDIVTAKSIVQRKDCVTAVHEIVTPAWLMAVRSFLLQVVLQKHLGLAMPPELNVPDVSKGRVESLLAVFQDGAAIFDIHPDISNVEVPGLCRVLLKVIAFIEFTGKLWHAVDEVTEEHGIEYLNGLHRFLNDDQLTKAIQEIVPDCLSAFK
eukprot:3990492-Pyramimonas_sp.AAC.1